MRNENQGTINQWQNATFGGTTPWAAFERMQKEYWELRDAVHAIGYPDRSWASIANNADARDIDKAREELADVFITLCRVADELGCDLAVEVDRKMAINRERKWVLDGTGNGQHA